MTNLQNYRKQQKEAVVNENERIENESKSRGFLNEDKLLELGINPETYKMKDGSNYVRFLPIFIEGENFFKRIFTHWAPGISFLCPKQHSIGDGYCPHCAEFKELMDAKKDGVTISEKKLGDVRYRKRVLYFGRDITDGKTVAEGNRLFELPITLHNYIAQRSLTRTGEVILICDPEEGRDIHFKKTGQKMSTEYQVFDLDAFDSVTPEDWYINLPPIDDILLFRTANDIKELAPEIFEGESTPIKTTKSLKVADSYDEDDLDDSFVGSSKQSENSGFVVRDRGASNEVPASSVEEKAKSQIDQIRKDREEDENGRD